MNQGLIVDVYIPTVSPISEGVAAHKYLGSFILPSSIHGGFSTEENSDLRALFSNYLPEKSTVIIRIKGYIIIPTDDPTEIRFKIRVTDGIRIWLNNELIIDDWKVANVRTIESNVSYPLKRFEPYPIMILWFSNNRILEISDMDKPANYHKYSSGEKNKYNFIPLHYFWTE